MGTQVDTIIVGAGLTGLTAAYFLGRRNKSFLVLEKSDRIGGVIKTERNGNFLYEEGPNTGIVGTPEIASLFEEIREYCSITEANNNVNKRLILNKRKWQALPSGIPGGIRTPLFTLKDKVKLLGEPFRKPGSDPEEKLADLVVRRMGRSFLDYAIDPFILGVYAGDPQYLVTKYAFPKLYNLEQNYGSFIGGAIKKKFENKSPEEKKITRKVFSTDKGMGGLTETLSDMAGKDHFLFNCRSVKVVPDKDIYRVSYHQNYTAYSVEARHVITTIPAFELGKVLNIQEAKMMKDVADVRYAPVVQVTLGYKQWEGMPLDAFGGLIPFKENRPLLGILFMSSLFKGRAPENGALLSVFMGGMRRPEIVNMAEDEIVSLLEREIPDLLKLRTFNPDLLRIIRYNFAIPQYGPDSKHRFNAAEKIGEVYPGLHIGGNLRDGIGMADRVKQGKFLADAVNS